MSQVARSFNDRDDFNRRFQEDIERFERESREFFERSKKQRAYTPPPHPFLDRSLTSRPFMNDYPRSEKAEVSDTADRFVVSIDAHGFRIDELRVSLAANLLNVEGKHEEGVSNNAHKRSFTYSTTIPSDVNMDSVRSNLLGNGKLVIEAAKYSLGQAPERPVRILPGR